MYQIINKIQTHTQMHTKIQIHTLTHIYTQKPTHTNTHTNTCRHIIIQIRSISREHFLHHTYFLLISILKILGYAISTICISNRPSHKFPYSIYSILCHFLHKYKLCWANLTIYTLGRSISHMYYTQRIFYFSPTAPW